MKKTNSLYVSSPVNALVKGILREDKTLKEVLEHGDFGLGTFNDLDGEMVLLDGVFYDLHSDGKTNVADINLETPYACVTHFKPETSVIVDEELTFDTYETFFEFNAQQGEGQSRVTDVLMSEAKMVAMYDLVAYAVSQTFQGIISRNPDADYDYQVTTTDIVEGINAAREIIGPLVNNPVFSVQDQEHMSRSVNFYFNQGWNSNDLTSGSVTLSELAFSALINRENSYFYDSVSESTRMSLARANRFSSNFLSTYS